MMVVDVDSSSSFASSSHWQSSRTELYKLEMSIIRYHSSRGNERTDHSFVLLSQTVLVISSA